MFSRVRKKTSKFQGFQGTFQGKENIQGPFSRTVGHHVTITYKNDLIDVIMVSLLLTSNLFHNLC